MRELRQSFLKCHASWLTIAVSLITTEAMLPTGKKENCFGNYWAPFEQKQQLSSHITEILLQWTHVSNYVCHIYLRFGYTFNHRRERPKRQQDNWVMHELFYKVTSKKKKCNGLKEDYPPETPSTHYIAHWRQSFSMLIHTRLRKIFTPNMKSDACNSVWK